MASKQIQEAGDNSQQLQANNMIVKLHSHYIYLFHNRAGAVSVLKQFLPRGSSQS